MLNSRPHLSVLDLKTLFPAGAGNFSLHHRVQNGSGAYPASYPMGTSGSFLQVKWPGREADHSPTSSAEVTNAWSYTSPNTFSCRGASLSTGTTIPLPLPLTLQNTRKLLVTSFPVFASFLPFYMFRKC
jgi:hypothetical protein